ncbi:hypothetical protein APA386B_479 [Acetobacter pasteurianus 386B]|nr:hypothetical protein APA386B_479 [Acetobacter pasteurianus 386B]
MYLDTVLIIAIIVSASFSGSYANIQKPCSTGLKTWR